jgi:hypothetical protein
MKITRSIGMILLAAYLILVGILALFNIQFSGADTLVGILALAAGIVLLVQLPRGRWTRNLGIILLAIWLILEGLLGLFGFHFSGEGIVLGIIAIVAGAILLFRLPRGRLSRNLGIILLSIWLILEGLLSLFGFSFASEGIVLGILAIAAGVLILFER